MSRYRFDGKTVVITGGAGGLGTALAHRFGRAGAVITAIDYDETALATLHQSLQHVGIKCHTYTADVTNPVAVKTTATTLLQDIGNVDVLINNAGISHRSLFVKTWGLCLRVISKNLKIGCFAASYNFILGPF